jgi:hypothetical protein
MTLTTVSHVSKCPVSLAAIRLEGVEDASVTPLWIRFRWENDPEGTLTRNYHDLPLPAQNFIRAFDDGRKVKPFTFTVTIPD